MGEPPDASDRRAEPSPRCRAAAERREAACKSRECRGGGRSHRRLGSRRRRPDALAFYAGLRRAEIRRLDWPDVELDGYRLVVCKAKSAAGTGRRPPIGEPLRPILLNEFMPQGRRESAAVSAVSVMLGKIAERARRRRAAQGLESITLHECRHTYASFLMAAGYTLRELMEYM
jgi:integrase